MTRTATRGVLAPAAVVVAAVTLAALLLFGGGSYTVKARFINASQLVTGNPVQIGGVPIGSVKSIALTRDGQAEVELSIDAGHAPLRRGTRARIRQFSQSGLANRYVDLQVGPQRGAPIPDGGSIGIDRTTAPVDLDQLFNTLDAPTRRAVRGFLRGSARGLRGMGAEARAGLLYLDPALSTSGRLFSELSRDRPALERFLVDSSRLMASLADRRRPLGDLVGDLKVTTAALGDQEAALGESLERLPPFLRSANMTFVNLRAALDDLDPLVSASRPVARQLGPVLTDLRGFAAGARAAVPPLRRAITRRGESNDLTNLLRATPALADIASQRRRRFEAPGGRRVNVGNVRAALPEASAALKRAAPIFSVARPYTADFLGWLDDFSTTGPYDALGGLARPWTSFSEILDGPVKTGQLRRCPGGADFPAPDRSNVLTPAEQAQLDCSERHRAPGP
jgi:phospholipid/cholesterol/gamma-HCH transport system substrate-binding protein